MQIEIFSSCQYLKSSPALRRDFHRISVVEVSRGIFEAHLRLLPRRAQVYPVVSLVEDSSVPFQQSPGGW